jgi:hypothetical protein
MMVQAMYIFINNEVIKAWHLRDIMQEEITSILDNLEESIITKN